MRSAGANPFGLRAIRYWVCRCVRRFSGVRGFDAAAAAKRQSQALASQDGQLQCAASYAGVG
ncbi:hypothetical protein BI364_00275 [Acidihalobacter yilgarnensis]|uniref:Uncharacterized protein n=1 Tax=Acidihalobacter yilgarnensis TaxID=2819280 RepID=A0A1D8IJJ3_9GAMM|nr:hypothetical protein BI364_00275 [Acidihalobacter yilgarnensis]